MRTIMNSPEQRQIVWDRKLAQIDYDTQMESARNKGITEGVAKGENNLANLITRLRNLGRVDDVFKAAEDKEYREKLYKEFQMVQ